MATGHNDPIRNNDLTIMKEMQVALENILDDAAVYDVVETDWGPARQYKFNGFTILTRTTIS